MFKNEYQGGPYVDVFSAQGRDPAAQWKLTGSVKKEFDKLVRGYVYALEGGASTTTTRMQLPKADKSSLCLVQPCCVFQLMVPDSAKLTVDLSIIDEGGSRRRIHLSSSQREVSATHLNAKIPLGNLVTDQATPTSNGEDFSVVPIPRAFHISSVSVKTQIVSPKTWEALAESKLASNMGVSSESSNSDPRPTHVAFGKKVAIPDHILTSRQLSHQEAGPTQLKQVGGVQPHPPSAPADQSLLRIQRSRVRSVSRKLQSKKPPSSSSRASPHTERNTDLHQAVVVGNTVQDTTQDVMPTEALRNTDGVHSVLSCDEQLAIQVLHKEKIEDESSEPEQNAESTSHVFNEQVYSFRSAPKSAERRLPSLPLSDENSSRGARLEEDFLSHSHTQEEGTPPPSPRAGSKKLLENTRLSDDYDWRQYASVEDRKDQLHHSADESLRTRLASRQLAPSLTNPDTGSSGYEDTLSESLTLSGLAEHLREAPHASLLDSLETRTMGGMLSPALLDTGQQMHTVVAGVEETDNGHSTKPDEMELMYDPQLNCFYDPLTCKYYELIQPD